MASNKIEWLIGHKPKQVSNQTNKHANKQNQPVDVADNWIHKAEDLLMLSGF